MNAVKLQFAICLRVMHRFSCTFTILKRRRRPTVVMVFNFFFFVEWAGIA